MADPFTIAIDRPRWKAGAWQTLSWKEQVCRDENCRTQKSRWNTAGPAPHCDDWNAITIIATSQSSPLKAVAEFVENSIDAKARRIVITRGRDRGEYYLRIIDDGEGIRRNAEGEPDFAHVATHICDSIKRRLKAEGARGVQGEFGIGLLSFWTVASG